MFFENNVADNLYVFYSEERYVHNCAWFPAQNAQVFRQKIRTNFCMKADFYSGKLDNGFILYMYAAKNNVFAILKILYSRFSWNVGRRRDEMVTLSYL